MSKPKFTPGPTATAGELQVGDLIYARHDHITKEPSAPVRIEKASTFPSAPGLVRFTVQSPCQRQMPWVIGPIRTDKPFTRAVPEGSRGVITVHRHFPDRKTLGTRYNLKPDTQPVEARRLQSGDIVVLEPECPIVVTRMRRADGGVRVWGRYIWEPPHAPHWPVGDFGSLERVARAIPGEYPRPTR